MLENLQLTLPVIKENSECHDVIQIHTDLRIV